MMTTNNSPIPPEALRGAKSEIEALRAQVETLTRERDEAQKAASTGLHMLEVARANGFRDITDAIVKAGERNALKAEMEKAWITHGELREDNERLKDEVGSVSSLCSKLAAEQAAREKMREMLGVLNDYLSCACTKGSFIYGCNRCRLRKEIIEPALAVTPADALRAKLMEVAERAFCDGCFEFADANQTGQPITNAWLASQTRKQLTEGAL